MDTIATTGIRITKDEVQFPIPETRGGAIYPWGSLNVGDSFLVAYDAFDKSTLEAKRLRDRIRGAVLARQRAFRGTKFIVRTMSDGVRVWRTQ